MISIFSHSDIVYSMTTLSDLELQSLTQNTAHYLLNKIWYLTCAESCTGGWVAKCCTDLAGSSAWFERGFVTYSNQAKQDCLRVKATTLEQFGAVSEQTAIEMAEGAIDASQANISLAITGIAGPDGGTKHNPVGSIWFAWALRSGSVITKHHVFKGDRDAVRRQAVAMALQGVIDIVKAK